MKREQEKTRIGGMIEMYSIYYCVILKTAIIDKRAIDIPILVINATYEFLITPRRLLIDS